MFTWFTVHELAVIAFGLWLFTSIGFLPRLIANRTALVVTTLAVGMVLAWLASRGSADPWAISINTLFVILAGLGGSLHAEIIFRRTNGYWRLTGPRHV